MRRGEERRGYFREGDQQNKVTDKAKNVDLSNIKELNWKWKGNMTGLRDRRKARRLCCPKVKRKHDHIRSSKFKIKKSPLIGGCW